VNLHFTAEFAELLNLKLSFTFSIHVNLVPFCNIVLVFTDGTN